MSKNSRLGCCLVIGMLAVALVLAGLSADQPAPAIDWNKAQQLLDREKGGEKLSPEEQAYLDHAKQVRRAMPQEGRPASGPDGRGKVAPPPPPRQSTGLVPLPELTAADAKYKGEDGGLYGGGANVPPKPHSDAALKEIARIAPLDAEGKPDNAGKIVLLSMGMSNTTQEFSRFKELADNDPAKSPRVAIVDCAQGGQAALEWNGARGEKVWAELDRRLAAAGVTARQVQIVFLKQALIQPSQYGESPAHAKDLKTQVVGNLNLASLHFPNLRVAFMSSRIYAGYAITNLNPEPYAYESAFAVRWLIQDQIKGDKNLNWDPAKGEVKAPIVLWGPYLWADGMAPRKGDGLIYKRDDLGPDGAHPSRDLGRQKVAEQLLRFFKTDPFAKGWFVKPAA